MTLGTTSSACDGELLKKKLQEDIISILRRGGEDRFPIEQAIKQDEEALPKVVSVPRRSRLESLLQEMASNIKEVHGI